MDRCPFSAQYAVPLTLGFVIADQTAYCGQQIVLIQYSPRLIQLPMQHQLDNFRNRRVDWTSSLALWIFAVEAPARLVQNMLRHPLFPSPFTALLSQAPTKKMPRSGPPLRGIFALCAPRQTSRRSSVLRTATTPAENLFTVYTSLFRRLVKGQGLSHGVHQYTHCLAKPSKCR